MNDKKFDRPKKVLSVDDQTIKEGKTLDFLRFIKKMY